MKIIGEATTKPYEEMYIVTASKEELTRIAGTRWSSEGPRITPGAVINVHAMFDRLEALHSAAAQLLGAQTTLRVVADLLDPIIPAIETTQEDPK